MHHLRVVRIQIRKSINSLPFYRVDFSWIHVTWWEFFGLTYNLQQVCDTPRDYTDINLNRRWHLITHEDITKGSAKLLRRQNPFHRHPPRLSRSRPKSQLDRTATPSPLVRAVPRRCQWCFCCLCFRSATDYGPCLWWVGEWVSEWVGEWVSEWVGEWVSECVVMLCGSWVSLGNSTKSHWTLLGDTNMVQDVKMGTI